MPTSDNEANEKTDPSNLNKDSCLAALAYIRNKNATGFLKYCTGLWVDLCGRAFLYVDPNILSTREQAKDVTVFFPASAETASPRGARRNPKYQKAKYQKREVKLDPHEFFFSDKDSGFTIVAIEEEDKVRKYRPAIDIAKAASSASWPAKDETVSVWRCTSADDPPAETVFKTSSEPTGWAFSAHLASASSGRQTEASTAPIFENDASQPDDGFDVDPILKLVAFTRSQTGTDLAGFNAIMLARTAEAKVAIELFNRVLRQTSGATASQSMRQSKLGSKQAMTASKLGSKQTMTSSLSKVASATTSSDADLVSDRGMQKAYDCLALRRCAAHDDGIGRKILTKLGCAQLVSSAMEEFGDHTSMQEQGCAVFRNLAVSVEDAHESLQESAAEQRVCVAMQRHVMSAAVQEHGCGALGNMACSDWGKNAVVAAGGLECVVNAMEYHQTDAGVQLQAIGALWNLGVNHPQNRELISNSKSILNTCKAMLKHKMNAAVQANACAAIGNIVTQNPTGKEVAAKQGIATYVCAAMNNHAEDAAVQRHACAAIWSLTANSLRNQDGVKKMGGVTCICKAMQAHINDVEVQESACGALRSLTALHEELKEECFEAKAIERIHVAMRMHGNNIGLQRQACGTILNMSAGSPSIQLVLASEKSLELLFEAIERTNDASLLESGSGALRNLAADGHEEVRSKMMAAGLLRSIGKCMMSQYDNMMVQRQCFDIVVHLCHDGKTNCGQVVSQGTMELVNQTMHSHPYDALLQERACHIIRWLADVSSGTWAAVGKSYILKLVVRALSTHVKSAAVQLRGLSALLHLAGGEAGLDEFAPVEGCRDLLGEIVDAGGVDMAIKAMQEHIGNAAVLEVACRFLLPVCVDRAERCVQKGILHWIVRAMQKHARNVDIHEQVSRLISVLARSGAKIAHHIANSDKGDAPVEELSKSMKRFIGIEEIQLSGLQTLLMLINSKSPLCVNVAVAIGSLSLAHAASTEHSRNAEVQILTCQITCRTAMKGQGLKQEALELGALDNTREIMQRHKSNAEVHRGCFEVLSVLEEFAAPEERATPPVSQRSEAAEGAALSVKLTAHAVHTFWKEPDTQRRACALLQQLLTWYPEILYEPEPEVMAYKKGDKVMVRDDAWSDQKAGIVAEIDPLTIKINGWRSAFAFDHCRFEDDKDRQKKERELEVERLKTREEKERDEEELREKNKVAESEKAAIEEEKREARKDHVDCMKLAEFIRDALEQSAGDVKLHQEGCRALWTMMNSNPGGKVGAVKANTMDTIVRILSSFPQDGPVHRFAIAVLWGLTANRPEGKQAAFELKALGMVCASMKAFPKDEALQEYSNGAIGSLVTKHKQNQAAAIECGAPARICEAMRNHSSSERVCRHGAAALATIATDSRAGRIDVAAARGVDLLCDLVHEFKRSPHVAKNIFWALWNLATEDSYNKEVVINKLGINGILACMEHFSSDPQVQRHGCQLIQCLCFNDKAMQEAIAEQTEGIEQICMSLHKHEKDAKAQREALGALGNIAFKNLLNKRRIGNNNGVELAVKAIGDHRDQPPVIEVALWAIGNLVAGNVRNQHTFVAGQGRELVASLQAKHIESANIQKYSSAVLRRCEGCEDQASEKEEIVVGAGKRGSERASGRGSRASGFFGGSGRMSSTYGEQLFRQISGDSSKGSDGKPSRCARICAFCCRRKIAENEEDEEAEEDFETKLHRMAQALEAGASEEDLFEEGLEVHMGRRHK